MIMVPVSHMWNIICCRHYAQDCTDFPWTLANALEALRRSNSDRTCAPVMTQLERTNNVFFGMAGELRFKFV
jgi:hypothetical protein